MVIDDKFITIEEMATAFNISRRAVAKQISKLKQECKLVRVGSDKGGHWEIVNEK